MDNPGFRFFGIHIAYYGVILTFAILVACAMCFYLTNLKNKREGSEVYYKDVVFDMALIIIPLGIIGARVMFVIFDPNHTLLDFFDFRSGGIAIYGAIILGALGLAILALIKKKSFFLFADVVVVCLILAQAIGRWGNFVNGEVYGVAITNSAFQWFPIAVFIEGWCCDLHGYLGGWHLATFFIESMFNFAGFALLLYIFLKSKHLGITCAVYLIFYGVVRAMLETVRLHNLMIGSLQISFLISLISIVAGAIILVTIYYKNKQQLEGVK